MGNALGIGVREFGERLKLLAGLSSLFVLTMFVAFATIAISSSIIPGLNPTVISSGSMRPAMSRGDVVVYRSIQPEDVWEGAVIAFEDPGGSIVHRVEAVRADGGWTTRGDANVTVDTAPVYPQSLLGVGMVLVPWVGLPTLWMDDGGIGLLVVTLTAAIALVACSRWAWSEPAVAELYSAPERSRWMVSWIGTPVPHSTSFVDPQLLERILKRGGR